jgi:hypothetical protein
MLGLKIQEPAFWVSLDMYRDICAVILAREDDSVFFEGTIVKNKDS